MKKNDVCYVTLDPTVGAEINKSRPCIIVSPDEMNDSLKTVMVVPITSQERDIPTRIRLDLKGTGLREDSWAVLDQLRTVDKSRISPRKGRISQKNSEEISSKLCEMFG